MRTDCHAAHSLCFMNIHSFETLMMARMGGARETANNSTHRSSNGHASASPLVRLDMLQSTRLSGELSIAFLPLLWFVQVRELTRFGDLLGSHFLGMEFSTPCSNFRRFILRNRRSLVEQIHSSDRPKSPPCAHCLPDCKSWKHLARALSLDTTRCQVTPRSAKE